MREPPSEKGINVALSLMWQLARMHGRRPLVLHNNIPSLHRALGIPRNFVVEYENRIFAAIRLCFLISSSFVVGHSANGMAGRHPERAHCGGGAVMPDDLPLISGFTRTCFKDADFLTYLLRSICRFGFPLLAGMTVAYARREAAQLEPLLRAAFPWAQPRASDADARIAATFRARAGRPPSLSSGRSFLVPGVGYHAALIDKLDADALVGAHATRGPYAYIMYFDSDNLLTRPLVPADVFAAPPTAPDAPTAPNAPTAPAARVAPAAPAALAATATRYRLRLPAIAWRGLGATHEGAWRGRLARMLGLPPADVRLSTMCRGGGLTFPRWLHAPLRAHLNRTLGVGLAEHAAALLEDQRRHDHMAADYELLGGYLYYVAPRRGDVVWDVEDGSAAHPWANASRRAAFPVLQENSWTAGGLSIERRLEYECILGASRRAASALDAERVRSGAHRQGRQTGWCAGLSKHGERASN
jgi:hypothetical protein